MGRSELSAGVWGEAGGAGGGGGASLDGLTGGQQQLQSTALHCWDSSRERHRAWAEKLGQGEAGLHMKLLWFWL